MTALRTECVIAPGRPNTSGYGRKHFGGKQLLAHRVAWIRAHGAIPDGLHVLHHCDNPPCINVDHLFLGTHADNMADLRAKGRATRGMRSTTAVLNDLQVADIRSRAACGEHQARLAQEYGVTQSTVSLIVNRRRWRHF